MVDDYSFTYHPTLNYFCPTHKECSVKLRRGSELITVPKFEVRNIYDPSQDTYAANAPRELLV